MRATVKRPHPTQPTPVRAWVIPVCVAVITFVAWLPALRNGFVSWDDERNFIANPHYRGLGPTQLAWMWTTFHMGHYVPLSWMSHGLDYVVWGMNPLGYHLTSILLHVANAVLLYFLARRVLRASLVAAGDERLLAAAAGFAALVFAVHPLRVESVAWVTERRDVLSLYFCLASLLSYLRGLDGGTRRLQYWSALALFACALLSKATSMSLPAVLLLLCVYPLRRLGGATGWRTASARAVYLELAPFAFLSLGAMALSIVALRPATQLTAGGKLAVSAYGLAFYLWKTVLPAGLSPLYQMPVHVRPLAPVFLASYVAVVALTALAWWARRRWPGAATAWVAFVVITLPMLGVVQNGPQIAADRYTYHSAPVVAVVLAGLLLHVAPDWRRMTAVCAAVLIAGLATLTWRQTYVWRDSASLWARVLAVDSTSSYAHSAWATLQYQRGQVADGVAHSREAIALDPALAEAYNNLGVGLARLDSLAPAVEAYRRALALRPSYSEAEGNWGVVLVRLGDVTGAKQHYARALALDPENADAHVNMGNAFVREGRIADAIDQYRAALDIRPDNADAHHNWGVALAREGRYGEAIEQFRLTLALDPAREDSREFLARASAMAR
ncbi:MAG: tetratricopeptide repeat protein [bacterium]